MQLFQEASIRSGVTVAPGGRQGKAAEYKP
jgi:hypothetical protein